MRNVASPSMSESLSYALSRYGKQQSESVIIKTTKAIYFESFVSIVHYRLAEYAR
ncbi:hypothetical protein [Endozoicomonas montiporae]|uniref:hypothetical protein n=1 Tax=Endozoicomonas montiporae TaxID=1027273 RepID=UPI000A5EAFD3|nr:hypothetical protein [Endozoicomonas montiporae]